MNRRIYLIVYLLFIIILHASAYYKEVRVQRATPDIGTVGIDMRGWYFPLKATSQTNPGFNVTIEFSTGATAVNKSILVIGTEYLTKSIDYCLEFKENGSSISVSRHVQKGSTRGFYTTNSWQKNLLKRSTNYVLQVDIDETRYRYSIYEKGKEDQVKYEYEFYGLASSYFRQQLMFKQLAVLVSCQTYAAQVLKVKDLGAGIGVSPILPKTDIRYAQIRNINSNLLLRRQGTTGKNDFIIQRGFSNSANDLWEIIPQRQTDRIPSKYDVVIRSLYKNTYINPLNCSRADNVQLIERSVDDCKIWTLMKDKITSNHHYLINTNTKGFAYVKDNSTAPDAQILQKVSDIPISSRWQIETIRYQAPLESGYYIIQNVSSQRYLSVLHKNADEDAYVVQHSNDHSDAKVWYLDKQPDGTYSIKNMDTGRYLTVLHEVFHPDAYIVIRSGFQYGSDKWIIDKRGDHYLLKNLASGKSIHIQNNGTGEDNYVQQESDLSTTSTWNILPVSFETKKPLGGMFKIRSTYTQMYLSVGTNIGENGEGDLITTGKADTNASWWTIENYENGAFLLRNVRNSAYATVSGRSGEEGARIILEPWRDRMEGHSLWHLHSSDVPIPNIYYLVNVFSGKAIFIQGSSSVPGTPITQQTVNLQDNLMRWELIPVTF